MIVDDDETSATARMPAVEPGTGSESFDGRLLGHYRLVSRIGEGGMGTVYRAEHVHLRNDVAIKVLQPELSRNREIVERFVKEARTTASLKHPGIVEVKDFGYAPNGSAFIVMELLRGESLTSRIAREGRLAWVQACGFARQLACSLAAAHGANVIHRDLKPENVLLVVEPDRSEERTKIVDFGIAKLADRASGAFKTRPDLIMGTPAYMSPQQFRSAAELDHRTDIYSLGCILFEMTCGRPPFLGESFLDLLNAHIGTPPPRPSSLAPELPMALEQLILRMLAKREKDRPQSMRAVAAQLDAIVEATGGIIESPFRPFDSLGPGSGGHSLPTPRSTIGGGPKGPIVPAAPTMRVRRLSSENWLRILAVAVTTCLLVLGAILARHGLSDGASAELLLPELQLPSTETSQLAGTNRPYPEAASIEPRPRAEVSTPEEPPRQTSSDKTAVRAPNIKRPGSPPGIPPSTPLEPVVHVVHVVHEIGCELECEILIDGAVIGTARPGRSFKNEIRRQQSQPITYLVRPIGHATVLTPFRALPSEEARTTMIWPGLLPASPESSKPSPEAPPAATPSTGSEAHESQPSIRPSTSEVKP